MTKSGHAKLERSMGLVSAVAMIVGIIIGSGIFITPVDMLKATNNVGLSLMIWLICGFVATLGSLCFAELGCYYTESGGIYTYAQQGVNDVSGFHILWAMMFVLNPASMAAKALAASSNILQLAYSNCAVPVVPLLLISLLIMYLFTVINMRSVFLSNLIQKIFTLMKVLVCSTIFIIGIVNISRGKFGALDGGFTGILSNINGGVVVAIYQGIFAFNGWYSLNFLTEELINPYKNLPRAIIISLPLITFIYLMTHVGYYTELTELEFRASNAIAVSFALKINKYFAFLIPFFVASSCIGSLNGNILSVPRMYFVAARKQHLPKTFSFIHPSKTPGFAVLFTGVVASGFIFASKTDMLISAVSFIQCYAVLYSVIALIKIKQIPGYKSPIEINKYIVYIFLVLQIVIIICGLIFQPFNSFLSLIIVVSGIPFYYIFVIKKFTHPYIEKAILTINHTYQRIFMAVPEDTQEINIPLPKNKKYEIINQEENYILDE